MNWTANPGECGEHHQSRRDNTAVVRFTDNGQGPVVSRDALRTADGCG